MNEYNGFEQNEEQNNTFFNEDPEQVEIKEEVFEQDEYIPQVVEQEQSQQFYFSEAFEEKSIKNKKKINPLFVAASSVIMILIIAGTIFAFNFKDLSKTGSDGGIYYHSSNASATNIANTSEGQFVPNGAELTTAEIAAKVGPCVVGIESKVTSVNIFQQQTSSSQTGSGVIVNEDGYIVTNYHVVEGGKELKVILNSGKEHPAKLVGYDERSDLAVVKIEEKNLTYATFGDSSQLMVGERAIAIGNPLGTELMGTVTQGIISAVNRTVQVDDKTLTLLQTDAAINSGNSGGALINSRGEVIGINTVKMYATGVEGIGFAIPSNEVKTVLDDIISYGYVRGRLVVGVTGTNITERMAKYYELPIGFYVSEVREGYGAYLAGVQVGDVIVKCDGKVVKTIDDINEIRDSHKVNDLMELVVSRNGKNVTLKVKLMEEKPDR